jgi:hypothetical protein
MTGLTVFYIYCIGAFIVSILLVNIKLPKEDALLISVFWPFWLFLFTCDNLIDFLQSKK